MLGLALDFSVIDTALTAKEAGCVALMLPAFTTVWSRSFASAGVRLLRYDDVFLVLDSSRGSYVAPVGFLTQPQELWAKIEGTGIQLCHMVDIFPHA